MDNQKKIENFLEDKLRSSILFSTSENFEHNLMLKIREESKIAKEEAKSRRIARIVIGSISGFMAGIAALIAILLASAPSSQTAPKYTLEPAIEASNNYLQIALNYISDIFVKLFQVFGLSNSHGINIFLGLFATIALFIIADRILVRKKIHD